MEISQNNGIEVNTIIGDAAYSGKENLAIATGQDIDVVARLTPAIAQGSRKEEDKFDYNKDAGMFVCRAGHLATRKARQGKTNRGKNQADTYYIDIEKCKTCPLRDNCYRPGAKTKTYSVTIRSDCTSSRWPFRKRIITKKT